MLLSPTPRRRVSIPLTPLIDVVFILLVFFMLASSLTRESSLSVQVGAVRGVADERVHALQLAVGADSVSVAGEYIALAQWPSRAPRLLAGLPSGQERRLVVVQVLEDAPVQALVTVLDGLTFAGAPAVQLMASRPR